MFSRCFRAGELGSRTKFEYSIFGIWVENGKEGQAAVGKRQGLERGGSFRQVAFGAHIGDTGAMGAERIVFSR